MPDLACACVCVCVLLMHITIPMGGEVMSAFPTSSRVLFQGIFASNINNFNRILANTFIALCSFQEITYIFTAARILAPRGFSSIAYTASICQEFLNIREFILRASSFHSFSLSLSLVSRSRFSRDAISQRQVSIEARRRNYFRGATERMGKKTRRRKGKVRFEISP